MSKKILFFVVLFHLFGVVNNASSEIIPLKKPIQTKEETQKKLLLDILKPLPKPITKTDTKEIKEKIVAKKQKKTGIILPKKKPLIAGSPKIDDVKIPKKAKKANKTKKAKKIRKPKKQKSSQTRRSNSSRSFSWPGKRCPKGTQRNKATGRCKKK